MALLKFAFSSWTRSTFDDDQRLTGDVWGRIINLLRTQSALVRLIPALSDSCDQVPFYRSLLVVTLNI